MITLILTLTRTRTLTPTPPPTLTPTPAPTPTLTLTRPLRFFVVGADGATLAHVARPAEGTHTYCVDALRAAIDELLAPSQ